MPASRACGGPGSLAAAVCLAAALGGCRQSVRQVNVKPAPPPVRRVTSRPANLAGPVFILEYHKVLAKESRWARSVAAFRRDLQNLYDAGFRPVTLNAYLEGMLSRPPSLLAPICEKVLADQRSYSPEAMRVAAAPNFWALLWPSKKDDPPSMFLPPGAMPVVFTFDDSDKSQFRLLPNGSLDPNCAIGVWAAFAKEHPDFPVRATFYVLPDVMWTQHKWWSKKLRMLRDWGCELGCHTVTHPILKRLSDERVKWEIANSVDFIEKLGFYPNTIALPYGVAPKNRALLKSFRYRGRTYGFHGVLLGGAAPARQITAKGFNPYKIQRIQGIDGFLGLSYWLNRVREGKVHPFVAP